MATFIKKKTFEGYNTAGEPVTGYRYWDESELMELLEVDPSRFFEVPESHAEHVLRKQNHYQELHDDVLEAYRVTVLDRSKVEVAETQEEWEARADAEAAASRAHLRAEVVDGGDVRGVHQGEDTGHDASSSGGEGSGEQGGTDDEPNEMGAGGPRSSDASRAAADKPRTRTPRRGNRSGKGRKA